MHEGQAVNPAWSKSAASAKSAIDATRDDGLYFRTSDNNDQRYLHRRERQRPAL